MNFNKLSFGETVWLGEENKDWTLCVLIIVISPAHYCLLSVRSERIFTISTKSSLQVLSKSPLTSVISSFSRS